MEDINNQTLLPVTGCCGGALDCHTLQYSKFRVFCALVAKLRG